MTGESSNDELFKTQFEKDPFQNFLIYPFENGNRDVIPTSIGQAYLLTSGQTKDVYEFDDPKVRDKTVLKVSPDLGVLREAKGLLLLNRVIPSSLLPKVQHVGMIEGLSPRYYSIVERARPLADPRLEKGKPLLKQVDEFEAYRESHPKFAKAVDNLSLYETFYSGDVRLLANWGINENGEYLFLDLDGREIPFDPKNSVEEIESINSQRIKADEMVSVLSKKIESAAQVRNFSTTEVGIIKGWLQKLQKEIARALKDKIEGVDLEEGLWLYFPERYFSIPTYSLINLLLVEHLRKPDGKAAHNPKFVGTFQESLIPGLVIESHPETTDPDKRVNMLVGRKTPMVLKSVGDVFAST